MSNRGWNWIPVAPLNRPLRSTPENEKNIGYDAAAGRFYLSQQNNNASLFHYYRGNYETNRAYAIDARWGEDDDIRMSLGDGPMQTSKIPFKQPIVSPMLTRMVGGVDNIAINAQCELVTHYFAQTRRETELNKRKVMSLAAAESPAIAQAFEPLGIYPDQQKTERVMDLTYSDKVQKGSNALMQLLAVRHNLNRQKRQVAAYMALAGQACAHFFVNGQNLEVEFPEPSEVGWDLSSIEPDRSDAEAVWLMPLMSVSQIAERYPDKAKEIMALEKWANSSAYEGGGWPHARPRVFTVYYKDAKKMDFGFVVKDGELEYCPINEIDPDTGKPAYTDADLQDPPEEFGRYYQAWSKKEKAEKKQVRWIENLRYCTFIPWEYMPGAYTNGQKFSANMLERDKHKDAGVLGDLILAHGECDLQEAHPDDSFSVRFPLKFSAWRYLGGHVVAPITVAIDSQRWINQITSDIAWRLRKAGGKSVVIDKNALIGTNQNIDDVFQQLKEGDPFELDGAPLGGVNNAVREVDTSPSSGTYQLMNMLPQMKAVAESGTGVYEANYGAPGGPNQLVGTLQLQLQQAGVMQQPYYAAIVDLYRQIYQAEAQLGKSFYGRRPWLLSRMTGDEYLSNMVAGRDMQIEQFRATVEMVMDNQQQRLIVDQQIIPGLIQLGILDPVTAADLLGRSVPNDVYDAARMFTKQAQAAAAEQAKQQQQQMMMQGVAMQDQAIADEEREVAKMQHDQEMQQAQLLQKLHQPQAQALSEHLKPQEVLGGATT
jgi:hypothetical protein